MGGDADVAGELDALVRGDGRRSGRGGARGRGTGRSGASGTGVPGWMVVPVAVVVARWSWTTQASAPSWAHSKRTGPRAAAARAPSRRTSSSTRSGSGAGAARASMKSSPDPGTPSTSRPPPASGRAAPDHRAPDALLGEHGGDGRPRRVLGGQEGERVPPAPLGREPARDRLGRAGAEPALAAAGGAAEAERGDPAADDGGGRDREAVAGRRPGGRRPCPRGGG